MSMPIGICIRIRIRIWNCAGIARFIWNWDWIALVNDGILESWNEGIVELWNFGMELRWEMTGFSGINENVGIG